MLPGTYVPTDPREIQAFAMEDAKKQFPEISAAIDRIETEYRNLGLKYHLAHLDVREEAEDHVHVKVEFPNGTRQDFRAEAEFIVKPNHVPETIRKITCARILRDEAKQAMHAEDGTSAKAKLEEAEAQVKELQVHMAACRELVLAIENEIDYQIEEPTPGMATEMRTMRRDWILALPEVQKAMDLGLYSSEEQAITMTLNPREEREVGRSLFGNTRRDTGSISPPAWRRGAVDLGQPTYEPFGWQLPQARFEPAGIFNRPRLLREDDMSESIDEDADVN